jgi:hypothetical protein
VANVVRQQHDAVGVEALCLQRVDTPHYLSSLCQINHRDGSVAHAFQVEQAVWDEQVALVGGQDCIVHLRQPYRLIPPLSSRKLGGRLLDKVSAT